MSERVEPACCPNCGAPEKWTTEDDGTPVQIGYQCMYEDDACPIIAELRGRPMSDDTLRRYRNALEHIAHHADVWPPDVRAEAALRDEPPAVTANRRAADRRGTPVLTDPVRTTQAPIAPEVIDLMAALEASLKSKRADRIDPPKEDT